MKKEKLTNLLHLWHGRHFKKNLLNSTVILPRFPLITGSNPSKRLPHDRGLNTHCTQNSICILEWTLGQSGDTSAGQLLCLLELGLVPLVVLMALPFTLPLKTLRAWPQQTANLLLGRAEANSGQGAQLLNRQEERLETPKKLFSDTTWKVPLFATSIFNASEL